MPNAGSLGATVAAVTAAAAVLLLSNLGATDLWAPDEPRYAAIAEEVRASPNGVSSWFLLRLNGEAYTQKPPLYYWLAALAGAANEHVSEFAARLPSALSGIATVVLTFYLGIRLFGQVPAAAGSALILLTTSMFVHLSRRAQLDVLLTLCEVAALAAFMRMDGRPAPSKGGLFLLHGALACAVLTKGPVGLLPLLVIAVYLAWEGRFSQFRRFVPAWGLALSVGPALLWILTATLMAPSGFFSEAVGENLFGRFFQGTSHARPIYYFFIQFPVNFLPWTLLWPLAGFYAYRHLRSSDEDTRFHAKSWRFLLAWLGVFFVFFSLSAGKRGLYLLPAFPAAALLCGAALQEATLRTQHPPGWLRGLFGVGLALLVGAGIFLAWNPNLEFAPGFGVSRVFALGTAAVAGVALVLCWSGRREARTSARYAIVALATVFAIEWLLFSFALPVFNPEKSPRPIAEAASRFSEPGQAIGVYRQGPLVGAMAYYGSRPVIEISDIQGLREFADANGGAVVIRARDLTAIERELPVNIMASQRQGRRRVVIGLIGDLQQGPGRSDVKLPQNAVSRP